MTIRDIDEMSSTISPSSESVADPEGVIDVSDDDWRNGRLVLRRPEARNSAVAKCYIEQTPEEAEELTQILAESVHRRRKLTRRQRADELDQLAALAAKPDLPAT